jgi:SAM-dependent methyltransferase
MSTSALLPLPSESLGLVVPDRALPFVILQRTRLQRLSGITDLLHRPYYAWLARLEARVWAADIRRSFVALMRREYTILAPFLPPQVDHILDIGCGVAAIDALVFQHYRRDARLTFSLLDRTQTDPRPRYGFAGRGHFYNSLEVARELLLANGVTADRIRLIPAEEGFAVATRDVDLAISLRAWGFHFPVETYLPEVMRALRPGGWLIIDVRPGTGGEVALRRAGVEVHEIKSKPKYLRLACRKPELGGGPSLQPR